MKSDRKHLMILGGGFGTLSMIRTLENAFAGDESLKISIISRENFFLFTPMLPEVASGSIETRHIVHPIRQFCKKIHFYQSEVESIDLQAQTVTASHPSAPHRNTWHYDYLVLALGSVTNFFGMPGLEKHSITLKTLGDAIHIRNHVIDAMEQAEIEQDSERRKELLTFVVAGGGLAGVELAGELNDFVCEATRHYATIQPSHIETYVIEAMPRILPEVIEKLAVFAAKNLSKRGIKILTGVQVRGAKRNSVLLKNDREIRTRTFIWTAGVSANPLLAHLDCERDERGRIKVNEKFELVGLRNVWAVGDCASMIDLYTGQPFPLTAQHAIREGKAAAKNIVLGIRGLPTKPFRYKMLGQLAMIGRRAGVGVVLGIPVHGFLAWWLWRSYYLLRLPTLQRKLRVMTDWTIDLFFARDIAELKVSRGVIVSDSQKSP